MHGVEWRRGAELAEYAEAVGIPTDRILAVAVGGGREAVAFYSTPGGELDDDVRCAHFRRASDGVLYVAVDEPTGMRVRDYLPPALDVEP